MAVESFVVHKEWLENIAVLPIEQQDKIIADLVRYGVDLEAQHADDAVVVAMVNMLKGRIDYSKDKYEQKVAAGTANGRKKKIDDQKIFELAREGKNSNEISQILGYSKSAVDHSDGWKNRGNEAFLL